jgi:hypothetical protein
MNIALGGVRVGCAVCVALCATLAHAASPDGIELGLSENWPSVTLQWTGGPAPYEVYRGALASTLSSPSQKIADTGATSLIDTPPAGGIHYYLVTAQSSAHPKLLIRQSGFQSMRDRSAAEPWRSMRTDAIAASAAGYVPGSDNSQISTNLIRCSSASALAYILDPPNARLYATRVRDTILNNTDTLVFGQDWGTVVPPANALFNLTLALDVVYKDLTAPEITSVEAKLQQKMNLVWTGNWSSAGLGALGTWAVYKGTRTTPDDAYYNSLVAALSLDGVFVGGRCYAWARWNGSSRYVKNMYMDVLEFTGVDRRYYENPRMKGLYEWLYGHSDAVFGGPISFGDCAIETARDDAYDEPPLYRAAKFGPVAGKYAGNHLPSPISGNLVSYIVPDGPLPAGEYPSSKVYPDGGGFFMEAIPSREARPLAMGGALWNVKSFEDHSHFDVNAIALAGYDEYLLMNSGYVGWGTGPPGYSWAWIHDDERSGNTLRTSRHASKVGGGVVEGFTGALLDYASADDGPALADDVHVRNFVFVHPDAASRPYFVLFDEVTAENGELIVMNLHPNTLSTTGIQTNVVNTEYTATIDAIALVPGNAKLTMFYATPPSTVRHLNGGIASWEGPGGGVTTRYLESEYATPASLQKNIVTILFPYDLAHAKAAMSRISPSGGSGAVIDHGAGIVDTAIESSGATPVTHGGNTFTGKAMLARIGSNGANVFYFVRKGTSFSTTNGPPVGFSSTAAVSVHMRGTQGRIVSPGTRVRFSYPSILSVQLDGTPAPPVNFGAGWVEVDVPAGTHTVNLLTS